MGPTIRPRWLKGYLCSPTMGGELRARSWRGKPARFVVVLLLAAACSSTTEDGASPSSGGLISLLESVPDTPETRSHLVLNDHVEAARQGSIARPSTAAGAAQAVTYLADLTSEGRTGLAVILDFYGPHVAVVDEWRAELGFSILNIDRDAVAGIPPRRIRIIDGSLDGGDVDRAVRGDPNYRDLLEVADRDGVSYYTWGAEAAADLARRSAARPVGRGGQLAVVDGRAIWTFNEAEMVSALDAHAGRSPSLADYDEFRLLVANLEAAGAYSAVLSDAPPAAQDVVRQASARRPAAAQEAQRMLDEAGFLLPYTSFALGAALGDDGLPQAVVVLVHADESTARENAVRFEAIIEEGTSLFTGRRWSDIAAVESATSNGRVMVARLPTTAPSFFLRLMEVPDSPLLFARP